MEVVKMKKLLKILSIVMAAFAGSVLLASCIYDDPLPEIRPQSGFVIATGAGGVSGTLNDDATEAYASLSQSSDSGLVLYLSEDKSTFGENAVVSYEFKYEVETWASASPNPKFLVRYGDADSSWSGWDPSYSDKTNYEDASGKSGTITNTIKLKSDANAIVFATNGYQWAGDSADSVKITVTKISVAE